MITLRLIDRAEDGRISAGDYAAVRRFWEARGTVAPVRPLLPTLGAIAERNGTPAACGFLYLDATGSGVAWLAWTASAPDIPRLAAGKALLHVLAFLEAEAAALGYWLITATLADPSFVGHMRGRGYESGDTGLCHLFKRVPPARGSS